MSKRSEKWRRVLWSKGVQLVTRATRRDETQARKLIGKWLRDVGDERRLFNLLCEGWALADEIGLTAYVEQALKPIKRARRSHNAALDAAFANAFPGRQRRGCNEPRMMTATRRLVGADAELPGAATKADKGVSE